MPPPNHRFYAWSRHKQNLFIGLSIGLFFLLIIASMSGLIFNRFWTLLLFPLIFIPAQFVDTPSGVRSGRFIYFSPLFIVEKQKDDFILHGGTLFDYLFVFNWQDLGEPARRKVVAEFLSGLNAFVHYLEDQKLHDVEISGTSYFFNGRNAERYGFETAPVAGAQQVIIGFNFLVLMATYSFTQGRLVFPPLNQLKAVKSDGKTLIQHKDQLAKIVGRLEKTIS